MSNLLTHYILVVVILLSVQNTGCSMIGFTGGFVYDHINADEMRTLPVPIVQIKRNTRVEVTLYDGTRYRGVYKDIIYSEAEEEHPTLIIYNDDKEMKIPVNSISRIVEIRLVRNTVGRMHGFGVGAFIDMVIIACLVVRYGGMNSMRNLN